MRASPRVIDALVPELMEDRPMPFWAHLIELRERIIWSLVIVALGAVATFQFSGVLLSWLAKPAGELVFMAPSEAFETRMRVALYGGFLLTLPLLLHQVWLFVARAMSREWRARLLTYVPVAYGLFLLGVGASLWFVLPMAMKFFYSFGSEGVRPMISLRAYLSFVTTMSLAFGATAEFPLVLHILNRLGVVQREQLASQRRIIYFASFVVAALLAPEVISQCALAAAICVFFELSLLTMRSA